MLQSEIVISRLTVRNEELEERVAELEDLVGDARRDNQALKLENFALKGEVRQKDQMLQSHLMLLGKDLDSKESGNKEEEYD